MSFRRFLILAGTVLAAQFLATATPAAAQGYEVEITGAPKHIADAIELVSKLKSGRRDYPTPAARRRAATQDVKAFVEVLKSAGYYAGSANYEVITHADTDQQTIKFSIDHGPLFTITEYEILYQDEAEDRPHTFSDADIKVNGAADGAALRKQQNALLSYLFENGYPEAEIVTRRVIANLDTQKANAVFVFISGSKSTFGDLKVIGLNKTDPDYVQQLKTWEPGEEFERSKIITFRDKLASGGLFSTINVATGAPTNGGDTPVLVNVAERKRRTIGAGVSFSTAEGIGGRLFFENRNMFGHAENLRIEARGSEIEQSINFHIARPWLRLPGQVFGNLEFANETTDAFDARSLKISGGVLKKWLNNKLETRAALALETSNVRADEMEERTYFISTPLSATFNTETNLLNPETGIRATWTVTPYTGTDSFTQTELSVRSRINFGADKQFTLAGRGAIGSTFGTSLDNLPRNKRLYAGGGGSIRGFAFQEAGPLDAEGDPIGGRSLIEASIEARAKLTKNIQLAGFVDAGSISANSLPNIKEEFFVGYGAGVRYLTAIGPIRIDAAFPVNQRETDRKFQIYIALGQPF